MHGGGYLATAITMAITYATGWVVDLSHFLGATLGEAWAHVTPGQAALVIGLLTYGTHNAPKLINLLCRLCRRLFRSREVNLDPNSP